MKVRYGQITVLLALITILSLGLSALTGVSRTSRDGDTVTVVAGFYPMYTAACQVAGDSDGVTVSCLTQPSVGCMHEYQLSPAERAVLEQADVLILNGAGAESFLQPSLSAISATVVDTSASLPLQESHDHHEHDGHTHSVNEHLWMHPTYYAEQVKCIEEALCAADPANAERYRANAAAYREQIKETTEVLIAAAQALPFDGVVLFHDSLAYPAEWLGLSVFGELPIGEDDGFSAKDVATVTDAVRGRNVLFLYDDQYPLQMTQLTEDTARSAIVSLNTAVRPIAGVADTDTWLSAMKQNIQRIREVAQ